jgi:hypothetical protein
MKKGKIFIGMLALLTAAVTAIAFKKSHMLPVDLYYYNSDSACTAAPCETINHMNKVCLMIMYTDSNCIAEYQGNTWTKNSDQ